MDLAHAHAIAERDFGLSVSQLRELGGNEDVNFLATTPEGARYVLKATATPRSALEAQTAVLGFLTDAVATFDVTGWPADFHAFMPPSSSALRSRRTCSTGLPR